MSINKFTTLLDLSRQAKIITGETATFDGKIEAGIPFSGYPTGVDTGTTVSLGVVSTQTAVFSGNTGTTKFDVSNSSSPNYNIAFSSYTATTWTNPIFSAQTSGLTLPITTLSADTQIVGPFWTLTQTGYTGEYIIGTQYTGYSVTYSFNGVTSTLSGTSFSGFTSASQENFSAGTLDYKGPLDYLQSVEDATIDGRLYTNKITISNGASASTIGYVLTQTGSNGEGEWLPNSSADTNTYVTGGTLSGTSLLLNWNNGGSANPINLSSLSGGTFTGNTSGNCITDIFVKNIHSCSPLWFNPLNEGDIIFGVGKSLYIDVTNNRLGIGKTPTLGTIDITGPNGNFIYRPSSPTVSLSLSGASDKTLYYSAIDTVGGIFFGKNGSGYSSTLWGTSGDTYFYSSDSNDLNIVTNSGLTGNKNIRFYAGQNVIGNTPDIHIQGSGSTRGYIGINTSNPEYLLDVVNTNSRLLYDPTSVGGRFIVSGKTNLPRLGVEIPSYLTKPQASVSLGIRAWDDLLYPDYGNPGDVHLYASVNAYGLNIISQYGATSADYIRFYAGQGADSGNTPDIHIQGSGVTRGYVGIGTKTPTESLTVSGTSSFKTKSLTTGTSPSFYYLDGVSTPTDTTTIKSVYKEFRPTTTSSSNVVGDATLLYPNITSPTNGEFYSKANLLLYTDNLSLLNSIEALTSEINVVQIQTNTGTYNDIVKSSSSVLRNLTSGGTINKYVGFWMNGFDFTLTHNGTTNNMYGFYMDDQSTRSGNIPPTSNRWGIYIDDDAKNYFAGSVGIGTPNPQYKLDILDTNSRLYYDPTSAGGRFVVSGKTNLPRFDAAIPSYLTNPIAGGSIGMRAWDDATYPVYGKVGDMHVYAGNSANGLNIINSVGTGGTEDYIRFYAGQNATGSADIHIQGSGVTKGYVGIGTETPDTLLTVSGKTKTTEFQMTNGATNGYVLTSDGSGNATWQLGGSGTFSGGTVTGLSTFTAGLSANTISATTIGSSGNCITDLYVSSIHSCSPLRINPLNEGEVVVGSNDNFYFDVVNNRIGIGKIPTLGTLDFSSIYGNLVYRPHFSAVSLSLSGNSYNQSIVQLISGNGVLTLGKLGNNYSSIYGTSGDTYLSSVDSNNLNFITLSGFTGGEKNIRFYVGQAVTTASTADIHIQGTGTTRGFVGIGTVTPDSLLTVNGKTKTTTLQLTSGATNGYVLTSDGSGNATWQVSSGGGSSVTTATTTTINFTGQTIYYNSTSPATGNITGNLTSANLGLIQKIYHNDTSEPTYPAGWVLMGDAIYFTSTLNIIYAEWAGGTRVEYWYVQEQ